MIQRIILSILVVPAIGCLGEAMAQADPGVGIVSSVLSAPGGVSWPVAIALAAWLVSRELRLGASAIARELRDWKPPTITLRLDDRRSDAVDE